MMNPQIFVWARETAGFTLSEAARKVNIKEHTLSKIEGGDQTPSRPMLLKMARYYRRPVVTFFLEDIPIESNSGADFRAQSDQFSPKDKAMVSALLRDAKASQQMIKATKELEEENDSLPFVGWLRRKWDLSAENETMERTISRMSPIQYKALIQDALAGLEMVLNHPEARKQYHTQRTDENAFKLIRGMSENAGIYTVLRGNLGSSHSKFPDDLFRAFVIADDVAPYIVINNNDTPSAKSFSILHEIIHLLLGQTGLSDFQHSTPIEKFCNQVAGEWLLPSDVIEEKRMVSGEEGIDEVKQIISSVCQQFNLSHTMVATRFYHKRLISHEVFEELEAYYTNKWKESREHKKKSSKNTNQGGGPSFYQIQRSQLGDSVIKFVKRMVDSGNLTESKAAVILYSKPGQVYELLNSPNRLKQYFDALS